MKKKFLLMALLALCIGGAKAELIPTLRVSFSNTGIVLSGTDATNHTCGAKSCATIADNTNNGYLGCTSNSTGSYYWVKYSKNDAVGTAFANNVTWEFLFRLDKQEGNTYGDVSYNTDGSFKSIADKSTGTTKFFSGQESGGWSFYNYSNNGIRLDVVGSSATFQSTTQQQLLTTGHWYHVIACLDRTNSKFNMYVNGQQVIKDQAVNITDFKYPNIGTTARTTDMWFNLGGDPGNCITGGTKTSPTKQGLSVPGKCDNSAQTTWKYVNIYNKSLSASEAASLYTSTVKRFTEPTCPAPLNDLILDAVFDKGNTAHDVSSYKSLAQAGTPVTQYNSTLKRYELSQPAGASASNANFFYRYYGNEPAISSQLGDAFSIEYYALADANRTADNYASMAALSAYQGGGFGSHINAANTNVPFTIATYGYHTAFTDATGKTYSASCRNVGGNASATDALEVGAYAHYVYVFDRNNGIIRIYKNGTMIADNGEALVAKGFPSMSSLDNIQFPMASSQWFAVGGDANSTNASSAVPTTCDFPWQGTIATARVWGKALTETDINSLYTQATATSKSVTLDAQGYATICVPFAATIPEGVTAYVVSNQDAGKVYLRKVAAAGDAITSSMPVILKGTAGAEMTLDAADISAVSAKSASVNLLDGSYITKTVTAGTAYKLVDGQFVKCGNEDLAANTAFMAFEEGGADSKTLTTESPIADGARLVDISFDENGIVNNGVEKHETRAYSNTDVAVVKNIATGTYMGATKGDYDSGSTSKSFYYCKYDKDDELGQAFANAVTWELLWRNDKIIGNEKIFSSQDGGGWTIQNKNGGIAVDYCQDNNGVNYTSNAPQTAKIINGKFYHIVARANMSDLTLTVFINGKQTQKVALQESMPFRYPNCGTIQREQGMWFDLGGDPSSASEPTLCQSPARSTFVFARIYKGALSDDDCKALYTDDVKQYTDPTKPNTEDLILDAVYDKDNTVHDASAWHTLSQAGKLQTQFNSTLQRYESVNNGTNTNFLYRAYSGQPAVTAQMGEAFSAEVYFKPASISESSIISPLSNQQIGGWGFEMRNSEAASYPSLYVANMNVNGYNSTSEEFETSEATISSLEVATLGYTHLVMVFDRAGKKKYFYRDGVLQGTIDLKTNDQLIFSWAPYQWYCLGGDTNSNTAMSTCDYAFKGNIAVARVWGKALTEADVTALNNQAKGTTTTVKVTAVGYATAIFPYAVKVPEGVVAYVVSEAGSAVQLKQYGTAGQIIPYGVPVIVHAAEGSYTFSAIDPAYALAAPETNLLEGSFATKTVDADGDIYILVNDNGTAKFAPMKAPAGGDESVLSAQRAWLPKAAISMNNSSRAIPIVGGTVTGIDQMNADKSGKNVYYDVQGRKVKHPTRGLYIKNGQKVFVK